jgi:hypothetical protein
MSVLLHNVPDTGSSRRRIQFRDVDVPAAIFTAASEFKSRSLVGLKPSSG